MTHIVSIFHSGIVENIASYRLSYTAFLLAPPASGTIFLFLFITFATACIARRGVFAIPFFLVLTSHLNFEMKLKQANGAVSIK